VPDVVRGETGQERGKGRKNHKENRKPKKGSRTDFGLKGDFRQGPLFPAGDQYKPKQDSR